MFSKIYKSGLIFTLFIKCLNIYAQPVITLNGQDTVRIKVHDNYINAGATAYDNLDGNLTDSIVFWTDLDTGSTGIYTEEYFVKNSKNQKQFKYRIIIVVLNIKPPTIKLIGPDTVYIEAMRNNTPFYDSGAIGIPGGSGPLSIVVVTGKVNTRSVGKYTLVYQVQDLPGNKAFAYRTIFVRDTRPPAWNNKTSIRYLQAKHSITDPVKATDAFDDSILFNVSYPISGPVDINKLGQYNYIYTAQDSSGNIADTLKVSYIVRDTIPPVINIIGNNPLKIQVYCTNKPYTDIGSTALDEMNGDLTNFILSNGTVNTLKTGTYLIHYTVEDSSGNISKATRTVIVRDIKAPRIVFQKNPIDILVNQPYKHIIPDVWDDSCDRSIALRKFIEIVNTNVNPNELGAYSSTYRVTDSSGNISDEATLIVNVVEDLNVSQIKNRLIDYMLYPLPVSTTLNIHSEFFNEPINFKIFDINGRLVYNEIVEIISDAYCINLSNLSSGLFIIECESGGRIYREKINKN